MRVALWADHIADSQFSGMGYHQVELLKALDTCAGEDELTAFYTPRRLGQTVDDLPLQRIRLRGLPGIRHAWYPAWHWCRAPAVDRWLAPVDLIHLLHANVTVPTRCPTIVWVVDLASKRLPETFPARRRRFKDVAIRRAATNPLVTFTTNTEYVKDDLCELYDIDPARVTAVPLGVNRGRFSATIGERELARARERYGLDRPYFLFVGLLSPRKNVDALIRAFERFRSQAGDEYALVLAGARGWQYDAIYESARSVPGVSFTGYVADEDLPALYSLADAFVFPSSYEGFGLPLLEAMACGTPVISTALTAIPEVVGDAAILVEQPRAEELAAAMARIVDDADLRERLVRRGLARAESFTWSRAAEACMKLYRERLVV